MVRDVVGAWCCGALLCVALFPLVFCGAVLGLVARGCLLVVCFGVGVPVWLCGLSPCGWCGLLWCRASLCRALWCCAVAWCCAAVLCYRFAVLLVLALPSCGLSCCAVLRCRLSVMFFARWRYLCAVVPFPSLPARTKNTAHRFSIYDLSVNSEMQLFRFQIISSEVTVEEIGKLIVNFLFPKSLWFEFHRQSRSVPACNCRGTDRRKMKVKEMPFSQNLPLGE